MIGGDFRTREGVDRRVDVDAEWQVWADGSDRLKNLGPLSAVMVAGYMANVDSVVAPNAIYRAGLSQYRRIVGDGDAQEIEILEQDIENRVGSVFNQSFNKLYKPDSGILNGNILHVSIITPKKHLLLSSDMSDYDHIISIAQKAKLVEDDEVNEKLRLVLLSNLVDRGYIRKSKNSINETKRRLRPSQGTLDRLNGGMTEVNTTAAKKTVKPVPFVDGDSSEEVNKSLLPKVSTPEHETISYEELRSELQPGITDVREYAGAMVEYIKKIGNEPFDSDDLVSWAEEQGFHPNRFEIERRVLLAATNASLIKKTNVHVSHKQVKEKWVLLEK